MTEAGFLDNFPALTPDGLFYAEDCPSYRVLDVGPRFEDENTGFSYRAGVFVANVRWGNEQNGNMVIVNGTDVTLSNLSDEGESESLVGELLNFEQYEGKTTVEFRSRNAQYAVIANSATVHFIKYLGPSGL